MATITLSPTQITYIQTIQTKVIREMQNRTSLDTPWGETTYTTVSDSYSGGGENFADASYVYPTTDKTTAWGSWTNPSGGSTITLIRVRNKTEKIKYKQMLVQFDTTGVAGTITGASLRLYATGGGTDDAKPTVYKITSAWDTDTVKWSNQPTKTEILTDQSLPLSVWTAFDVSGHLDGHGFALHDSVVGSNSKLKELPRTGDLAPQLLVTYTPYNSTVKTVTENVEMNGTAQGTVTLERYNDSYTHTVKVSLGTESQTFTDVVTSVSFTLPASWNNQVPNAPKGLATVSVWTYDTSGNQVGVVSAATFNAVVPEDIVPSVTVTAEPVNENTTVNGWGIYIQGYSKVKLTATGTAGTGATVVRYAFTGAGVAQTGETNICTSNVLAVAGDQTWQVTVTDSRGRTAKAACTGTVHPYFAPAISLLEAYRCLSDGSRDDLAGTYGRAQGTYAYASCGGNNTVTGIIKYALYGSPSESTVTEEAESGTLYQFGGGNLDVTKSYVVTMTVTDAVGGTATAQTIINTVSGSLFIGLNNDRISFGKPPTRAGLDCHFRAYFRETVTLEGDPLGVESGGTGGNTKSTARNGIGIYTGTTPPEEVTGLEEGDIYLYLPSE